MSSFAVLVVKLELPVTARTPLSVMSAPAVFAVTLRLFPMVDAAKFVSKVLTMVTLFPAKVKLPETALPTLSIKISFPPVVVIPAEPLTAPLISISPEVPAAVSRLAPLVTVPEIVRVFAELFVTVRASARTSGTEIVSPALVATWLSWDVPLLLKVNVSAPAAARR